MTYAVSLAAAFGCAACNGVAAILQKISADREDTVTKLDARLMLKLIRDVPYVLGIILDVSGWILTFIAVRYLPLFLVESIIAANIAVTALIERFVLHRPLKHAAYALIGSMLAGLIIVAISAAPGPAHALTNTETWGVLAIPIPVALAAFVLAKKPSARAATVLAALGGIAFGLTSVASRIFKLYHPLWHNLYNPYLITLVVAGGLGILLFSTALQRAHATIVNASMTAAQILVPTIIGILFLGDSARHGRWDLVILGMFITTGSAIFLALQYQPIAAAKHLR